MVLTLVNNCFKDPIGSSMTDSARFCFQDSAKTVH